ncbi:MerR family transcriptional regulator [Kribbella italica]|uniref:DNA-binding transcriptional MerR regulator n=1 Tax=Kribbella italica TaxID=1540520 RepID=A0A7W9J4I4_9ACTN|nr:DNA-binding transcriptional MerR regulator [Kribbella italica]
MLIGELSQRTGVNPRLLRYYEAQGLLTAGRGSNGYRRYADDSELTVRKIRILLDAGLTTEVIKHVLPCTREIRDNETVFDWCQSLRDLLDHELATLDGRLDSLQRTRNTLATYLEQT